VPVTRHHQERIATIHQLIADQRIGVVNRRQIIQLGWDVKSNDKKHLSAAKHFLQHIVEALLFRKIKMHHLQGNELGKTDRKHYGPGTVGPNVPRDCLGDNARKWPEFF